MDRQSTQKRPMRILRRRGTDIRSILADRVKIGGNPRIVIYAACCLLVLISIILHAGEAFEYTTEPPAKGFVYMPESGEILARNIPDGKKILRSFRILFQSFEDETEEKNCEIEVCFYRNGSEVRTWTFPASELRENPDRIFEFGRRLHISAEDHCWFTVVENYENDEDDPVVRNQVGLYVTGREPEEDVSYEEYTGVDAADPDGRDNSEDAEEDAEEEEADTEAYLPENGICYQLTMEDAALCGRVMRPFVAALVLLCAAAAFVIDLRRVRMNRLIGLTLFLIVLTGAIPATLMQQIVRDVPLHNLQEDDIMLKIWPGVTMEQTFEADLNTFTALELSIDGSDNRSDSVHILLEKEGEEEAFYDGDIPRAQLLSGGPAGLRIRISADQTSAGEVFPQGTYHIAVTNTDHEKKLRISMLEKAIVNGTAAGTAREDGESSAGSENSGNDESSDADDDDVGTGDNSDSVDEQNEGYDTDSDEWNSEDTDSDEGNTADSEEDITELREDGEVSPLLTLNYGLRRTSGMGYSIACVVFFLLAVYAVLVVFVTTLSHVSALRFFIVSAVPLGLIYLILMLPWSVPDTGSHVLAAYRLSNMALGADKDAQWQVRAEDAEYLPVEWKAGRIETKHFPDTEDYAGTFLRGRVDRDGDEEAERREMVDYYADRKMEYYSILCYLPQVIGLSLGRLLGLGPAGAFYLGRILILIAYIAACARAVRIAPAGKGVFASIALLPMCLMLSSSYSYDAMVVISTICFTASVLRVCHEPDSRPACVESALWAFVMGGVKGGGYLILLPLVFILFAKGRSTGVAGMTGAGNDPQARGHGDYDGYDGVNEYTGYRVDSRQARRKGFIRAWIILGAGIISVLLFDLILPSGSLFQFGEAGTGKMTTAFAILHPLRYLNMLLGAFLVNADSLTLNVAGIRLSWLEPTIPAVCIAGLLGTTAVWAVFERDQLHFNGHDRKIFLAVILLELLLTPAMLLSWTPAGSKWILGLQGRYFLPVLPLVYFIFAKFRLARNVDCPKQEEAEISRRCMRWLCILSCACVYYMLCTYLTR